MNDLIILLVGSLIGWFTARQYASRPAISYFVASRYVLRPLGQSIPLEIDIFHEKNKISNLVETKVGMWNPGTKTFSSSDISLADPLRLSFSGVKVLKAVGPKGSRPAVNPAASPTEEGDISVNFDIFDRNDGFVFVVYSGAENDANLALDSLGHFKGAIKSLPNGVRRLSDIKDASQTTWQSFIFPISVGSVAILAITRSVISFTPYEKYFWFDPVDVSEWKGVIAAIVASILGLIFLAISVLWIVDSIQKWATKPPKFIADELV